MLHEDIVQAKTAMEKSLSSLQVELQKLRTGRAQPSLLDHVQVEYYGNPTPLNQVANIATEDARTLSVSPWEQSMVPAIEKALRTSDLGLNPVTAGQVIRIPMPALTEDRRRDLIKLVKEEGEKCKVSIRNARRDANQSLKEKLKEKSITEDDERRTAAEVQKLTDQKVEVVEHMVQDKEKELMTV